MNRRLIYFFLELIFLMAPLTSWAAKPGQASLSLEAIGALPSLNLPTGANQGLGLSGSIDYRVSQFYDFGLSFGLVEFIAPTGKQDTKTLWLDAMERFFPLPVSSLGEPYLQLGFGFSPYLGGIFQDYWSYYSGQNLGEPTSPGTIYWDAQAAIGYLFKLSKDWSLDTGLQYDYFWPPKDTPLQTFGVRSGIVWSFEIGK